ncbi:MAG: LCP family protein [Oscillospiraceae bacterium]|nr:LCP family protein [Oscillospiraceae bacterium]
MSNRENGRQDLNGSDSAYVPKHGAEPVRRKRPAPENVKHAGKKKKHRRMNGKERAALVIAIAVALFLCIMMVLNMKIIPLTEYDQFGRVIEPPRRVSVMDKFRMWQPFLEIDGELESKEYSMKPTQEALETPRSEFDDGLDLDQIQEGQFSVLFLGTDESRSNTDVIMLVMFDIRCNQIHILQIPRDTFVPGYTSFEAGKLNSVYTLGNPDKQPVQRVVDCLEGIFRVPIDRYVTTSCSDIGKIVDIVGGVPIDMPYDILYEADKEIKKGKQVLTGEQAEWMVRFRHDYSEGDIGRMKAQRIFMAAAMKRVCDIGSIEMLSYINKIVDRKLIGSNLTVDEISKLSDFASSIGMENITMHMLPGEGYNYEPPVSSTEVTKYSVWMMHKQPVIRVLNDYFRPYFEDEQDLPIADMLGPGRYLSTAYDEDAADFQSIENGSNTFDGK